MYVYICVFMYALYIQSSLNLTHTGLVVRDEDSRNVDEEQNR
jgi:hypothetical protein